MTTPSSGKRGGGNRHGLVKRKSNSKNNIRAFSLLPLAQYTRSALIGRNAVKRERELPHPQPHSSAALPFGKRAEEARDLCTWVESEPGCPTPNLVNRTSVHPFVGISAMLLGVEVYHWEWCVELLRPGVVKGALFWVPSCALEEKPSDVRAVLRSIRYDVVFSRGYRVTSRNA